MATDLLLVCVGECGYGEDDAKFSAVAEKEAESVVGDCDCVWDVHFFVFLTSTSVTNFQVK